MRKIVILADQEGGVDKTIAAINLGASLATLKKSVLVVDADPWVSASSGLGIGVKEVGCSLYECIINKADMRDVIYTTDTIGLDVILNRIGLADAEIEMPNLDSRKKVTKSILDPVRDDYDHILIDYSPLLGLTTVSALTASDSVTIPVQRRYFALGGTSKLLGTVGAIENRLSPKLEIEGFLLTMYDSRLRLVNQIYDEVKRHF